MDKFKFYEVGGCIRDSLLGIKSKDIDYVAVPNDKLLNEITEANEMFEILNDFLVSENFEVFLKTNECFTIRAKFPENHKYSGVADFVMARKEIGYIEGTRTPIVIPGTLYDDLERRDATLNAIAKDDDGNLIDYFNGLEDLKNGILKTPLDCKITIEDDPLRIFRYFRFSITKDFKISDDLMLEMKNYDYEKRMVVVSESRIREELIKCFKFNSLKTLLLFNEFPKLRDYVFTHTELWLKPTNEK